MSHLKTQADLYKQPKSQEDVGQLQIQSSKQFNSEDQCSNNVLNMGFILSQSELNLSKSSIGFCRNFSISDISEIRHQEKLQSDFLEFDSQESQFSIFSVKKSSLRKNKPRRYVNNCQNMAAKGLSSANFYRKNYNRLSKIQKKPQQCKKDQLSSEKQFGKSVKTFFSEESSFQLQSQELKNKKIRQINNKGKLIHK